MKRSNRAGLLVQTAALGLTAFVLAGEQMATAGACAYCYSYQTSGGGTAWACGYIPWPWSTASYCEYTLTTCFEGGYCAPPNPCTDPIILPGHPCYSGS